MNQEQIEKLWREVCSVGNGERTIDMVFSFATRLIARVCEDEKEPFMYWCPREERTFSADLADQCFDDEEKKRLLLPLFLHPQEFPLKKISSFHDPYNEGWNDCVDAMIQAAKEEAK